MMSLSQMRRPGFSMKPGFSMVEIIFYVLIVAVLATGAVTGFNRILARAKKSTTQSSLQVIRQAIDTYYADVQPNRYPANLEDLIAAPEGTRGWEGPYLDAKEVDGEKVLPRDGWGRDFQYEATPGKAHPYELYSWGAGGEDAPQEEWISAWQ